MGAGPAAMGSAYSAQADDAYAPVWNPAGLGRIENAQASAQHVSYLESTRYEFASAAIPIGQNQGIGLSAQYLGAGSIQGRTDTGSETGSFDAHYAAYSLAYGRRIRDRWTVGLTGKIVEGKLESESAHAWAADLGLLYQLHDRWDLAMTALNLGGRLRFIDQADPLPQELHWAARWRPSPRWLASLEPVYSVADGVSVRMGGEWWATPYTALRAGYRTETQKGLSSLAGFTTGAAIKVYGQEFAYAWVPLGDLGNTQYFSLLLKFGRDQAGRSMKRLASAPPPGVPVDPDAEIEALLHADDSKTRAAQKR